MILQEKSTEYFNIANERKWYTDWAGGGCYLHLEVSEFIEALRGKGDPVEEAGDVLFVLLAMMKRHGINIQDAIDAVDRKLKNK